MPRPLGERRAQSHHPLPSRLRGDPGQRAPREPGQMGEHPAPALGGGCRVRGSHAHLLPRAGPPNPILLHVDVDTPTPTPAICAAVASPRRPGGTPVLWSRWAQAEAGEPPAGPGSPGDSLEEAAGGL